MSLKLENRPKLPPDTLLNRFFDGSIPIDKQTLHCSNFIVKGSEAAAVVPNRIDRMHNAVAAPVIRSVSVVIVNHATVPVHLRRQRAKRAVKPNANKRNELKGLNYSIHSLVEISP